MPKRIALIGHCGPDSSYLRMAVSRAALRLLTWDNHLAFLHNGRVLLAASNSFTIAVTAFGDLEGDYDNIPLLTKVRLPMLPDQNASSDVSKAGSAA